MMSSCQHQASFSSQSLFGKAALPPKDTRLERWRKSLPTAPARLSMRTMFGHFPTQPTIERKLFDAFAPGVAYISVEKIDGSLGIGTCFHVGENVFVTARHVVEKVKNQRDCDYRRWSEVVAASCYGLISW